MDNGLRSHIRLGVIGYSFSWEGMKGHVVDVI